MMWSIIFRMKESTLADKVRRNIVSASHCALVIALGRLDVNPYLTLMNSWSYFIWDTMYVLTRRPIDWTMLVHHILSLCLFTTRSTLKHKVETLTLMETGNIFNYIVYDLIKHKKDTFGIRSIQFLWFGYYRLVKIPIFISTNFEQFNLRLYEQCILYMIIAMGYIWTIVMAKQLSTLARSNVHAK